MIAGRYQVLQYLFFCVSGTFGYINTSTLPTIVPGTFEKIKYTLLLNTQQLKPGVQ